MKLLQYPNPTIADFTEENIIRMWCGIEAGYVHHPSDRGKETKYGVTYATAQENRAELVKRFGWNGQVRDLTEEMAYWVYKTQWWDRMRCTEIHAIHPFLADRVFDFAINAGRALGVKTLQRILNVCNRQGKDYSDITPDGGVGPATLGALRAYVDKRGKDGIATLIQLQFSLQGNHYVTLAEKDPTQEDFVNGWGARIRDVNNLYFRTKK